MDGSESVAGVGTSPGIPAPLSHRLLSPATTAGRRRLAGLVALALLVLAAVAIGSWSRFDTVRADMEAATRNLAIVRGAAINEITSCFQGFCFGDDTSRWEAWADFVRTSSGLVRDGVVLGLLAAGVVGGFFGRAGARLRRGGWAAVPAAAFLLFVFTPAIAAVAIVAGGTALVLTSRGLGAPAPTPEDPGPDPWLRVIGAGLRASAVTGGRFALVIVPLLALMLAAGAYAIQHLDAAAVDRLIGDHPLGIALAAGIGLVVPLPFLVVIPLVAGATLIGMGPAAATTLLVAGVAGSPLLLLRSAPRRRLFRTTAVTAVFAVFAGMAGVAWAGIARAMSPTPTIAFDGTVCSYSGPLTLPARTMEIRVENRTDFLGTGVSMGALLGRLPAGVTLDQLRADLAGLPPGGLPHYFAIAGEERFVFAGTGRPATFVIHHPGTYAVVCAYGGGGYVVREFSMFQPQGWYDEFRETFDHHAAPVMIEFTE